MCFGQSVPPGASPLEMLQAWAAAETLGVAAERLDRLMAVCSDYLPGLLDKVLVEVCVDTVCRRAEPLLRPVYRTILASAAFICRCHARTPQQTSRLLRQRNVAERSGHAFRLGAAQELTLMGHGHLPIITAAGWKSTAVVAR